MHLTLQGHANVIVLVYPYVASSSAHAWIDDDEKQLYVGWEERKNEEKREVEEKGKK